MVACAALVVPPATNVYTPQDLAHRVVGLDYGNGTAYAGLQMLEGAMPRDAITTCAASANAADRYAALLRGDFDATVLQEPYITVAAKAGCRLVSTTFFYGTWVGEAALDPALQAAFLRAITRAVARVNANKGSYVRYFLQDWAGRPEVDALTPADFDLGRIQLTRPGPIPERDARWAWEWMVSWGILEGDFDSASQLDNRVAKGLAATTR
jgi:ABC-type nitrate/sulfonate/bicarbonate transport system substrate-binding protein